MSLIIEQIRGALIQNTDEATLNSGPRFFKEEVKLHGVKTATVTKIGKQYFNQLKGQPKAVIFDLCEELWKSGYMEESFIACNWAYYLHNDYQSEDIDVFEHWIAAYVSNWASCDTLCNHAVGDLVDMYPELLARLKVWAKSDNRWIKRAAAVSLIIPARNGKFLEDVFEIADILLLDSDDLVQKGYGWMLKEASRQHQTEVYDYVVRHKKVMPRTALRYAIEKMPDELRKLAMAK